MLFQSLTIVIYLSIYLQVVEVIKGVTTLAMVLPLVATAPRAVTVKVATKHLALIFQFM